MEAHVDCKLNESLLTHGHRILKTLGTDTDDYADLQRDLIAEWKQRCFVTCAKRRTACVTEATHPETRCESDHGERHVVLGNASPSREGGIVDAVRDEERGDD